MANNNVKAIHDFGQSIWLDFLDRKIMKSGELTRLIAEDGICGVTSNPSIFEKAITESADYSKDIIELSQKEDSNERIFFSLCVKDIQAAADLFIKVYEESNGQDGYVSLEVSPRLARDTEGTISQARMLWKEVGRKNVMIKIPATAEGIPAIRQCISEGININITLLFGLDRYQEVIEAYLSGLEARLSAKQSITSICSVASFFLSRIDVLLDPMLVEKGLDSLKGESATAAAKKAYSIYQDVFTSSRFKKLEKEGARRQRLLWASTGTKDPSYSDVKYVESLIGPETINTVPLETLEAFRDHGKPGNNLEQNSDQASKVLDVLKKNNIDMAHISDQLEKEGVEKFNKAYANLLGAIEKQKTKALA